MNNFFIFVWVYYPDNSDASTSIWVILWWVG